MNILDNIIKHTETITNTYTYYGFNVYVDSLELNTSVTLRISIAYLLNNEIDKKNKNNGTYNFINKYVELKDEEYYEWGNEDNYLINYVHKNINKILDSSFIPKNILKPQFNLNF